MGMVALSGVLVPLIVTGAYGVVVSLMFVKAHLGMTTCTPQLPVHHHFSSASIQSACNMHCKGVTDNQSGTAIGKAATALALPCGPL